MTMFSSDVVVGTAGAASQFNNLRKDAVLGINNIGVETDAATITFDLSDKTKGKIRNVQLAGNRILAVSNLQPGQAFLLILQQDVTGGRTVTWFNSPGTGTPAIKWAAATPPTLSTTPNRYDIFSFIYDGLNIFGSVAGYNYG